MNPFFTDAARRALKAAAGAGAQRDQRAVEPRHVLLALLTLDGDPLGPALDHAGVEAHGLVESVTRSLPRTQAEEPPDDPPELPYTGRAEGVLEAARRRADDGGRSQVSEHDLLVALAAEKGITRTLLEQFGLDADAARRAVAARPSGEAPGPETPDGAGAGAGEAATPEDGTESRVEAEADASGRGDAAERREDTLAEPGPGAPPARGHDSTPAFRSSFDRSAPPEAPDARPEEEDEEEPTSETPAFRETLLRRRGGRPEPGGGDREAPEEPAHRDDAEPREAPAPDRRNRAPDPAAAAAEPAGLDFLTLDHDEGPLYEQIARGVQAAVATGELAPGRRLPPVRKLAGSLSISPGTAARAYQELEARDVVVTRGRRGTFVAEGSRGRPPRDERVRELARRLRPLAVGAYHMGAEPEDLRSALEEAMDGILT